ncbi:RING finger protein PFF0165c-like [Daktulosphaira vitifoliae]|uniref:RING finger protein PFF0165c-like n=1 Tax=Daktulosphaira vitifoliae TaxID=58002 RepID=UPI0021AA027C|nr:RING finger protein PFF0165c-like [Daktulosphaira vitifoliae]
MSITFIDFTITIFKIEISVTDYNKCLKFNSKKIMEIEYLGISQKIFIKCLKSFLDDLNSIDYKTELFSGLTKESFNKCIEFVQLIIDHHQGSMACKTNYKTQMLNYNMQSSKNYKTTNEGTNVYKNNNNIKNYQKVFDKVNHKAEKLNNMHHYFEIKDKQIQGVIIKTIMNTEATIITMVNEHEQKMANLQDNLEVFESKIQLYSKEGVNKKNKKTIERNILKEKLIKLIKKYDLEMIEKHKQVIDLNEKLKVVDDKIVFLKESIDSQKIKFELVMKEKEKENERLWLEKLTEIQRKIAARKIQSSFRQYLNYIRTKAKKFKNKGQSKKVLKSSSLLE